MYKKISDLSIATWLSFMGFVRNFSKDERGLSGVVVAILLILVAVLAVVLIWGFLSGWIGTMWDNIVGQSSSIS